MRRKVGGMNLISGEGRLTIAGTILSGRRRTRAMRCFTLIVYHTQVDV